MKLLGTGKGPQLTKATRAWTAEMGDPSDKYKQSQASEGTYKSLYQETTEKPEVKPSLEEKSAVVPGKGCKDKVERGRAE